MTFPNYQIQNNQILLETKKPTTDSQLKPDPNFEFKANDAELKATLEEASKSVGQIFVVTVKDDLTIKEISGGTAFIMENNINNNINIYLAYHVLDSYNPKIDDLIIYFVL